MTHPSVTVVVLIGISGLLLGGVFTARGHRSRIPAGLGTATLFVLLTLRFGLAPELPAYLYLAAIGVALALSDYRHSGLPDRLLFPSYIVAVALLTPAGAVHGDLHMPQRFLLGVLALVIPVAALQLAMPQLVDARDIALAGLLGLYLSWLSWAAVFVGLTMSILLAGARASRECATTRPASDGSAGEGAGAISISAALLGAALLAVISAASLSNLYATALGAA